MISDQILQQIQERLDLVQWVGRYVTLKKRGQNFLGLCPFHQEKTPSFTVSPHKHMWHCFGCQKGGNIFQFVMQIDNLSFVEAVKQLAEAAGVELPETGEDPGVRDLREKIYETLTYAQDVFRSQWPESPAMVYALKQRGLDLQVVERFGLGYGGAAWDALVQRFVRDQKGSVQQLMDAGLCTARGDSQGWVDRFHHRLTFPIRDARGRTLGFGGRILEGDTAAKYLNSPETAVYEKGQVLYGLYEARENFKTQRFAFLVEGYLDVLACHTAGIGTAVASLGTALTENQAQLLKRLVPEVLLCYDSDKAGREATLRAGQMLRRQGLGVRVVKLDAKDADELLKQQGPEALQSALRAARDFYEVALEDILQMQPLDQAESRSRLVHQYASFLKQEPDPVRVDYYLDWAATRTGVPRAVWVSVLEGGQARDTAALARRRWENRSVKQNSKADEAEKWLVVFLAEHPERRAEISALLGLDLFEQPAWRQAAEYLFSHMTPMTLLDDQQTPLSWLKPLRQAVMAQPESLEAGIKDYVRVLNERPIEKRLETLKTELNRTDIEADLCRQLTEELNGLHQQLAKLRRTPTLVGA